MPAGLGGNGEFERKFERKWFRMKSAWEDAPQLKSPCLVLKLWMEISDILTIVWWKDSTTCKKTIFLSDRFKCAPKGVGWYFAICALGSLVLGIADFPPPGKRAWEPARIWSAYLIRVSLIFVRYFFNVCSIFVQNLFNVCSIFVQYLFNISATWETC